jgi:DNA-binding transcriptional MerR regulator
MSLAEIEEALDKLSAAELAKLAAHIARRDKIAWDQEIEDDRRQAQKTLEEIDAEIDAGNFGPLP